MSRDIKSTDITGINDGLDRAINRLHYQMRTEMAESVRRAAEETEKIIAELKEDQQWNSKEEQEELRQRMEELQEELGAQMDEQAKTFNQQFLDNEAKYTEALQKMSDSFYDSMKEENERLSNQMQEWLEAQESAFAEQLDDVYATVEEQQEQIEALTESFDQFQADVDSRFAAQQTQIDMLHKGVSTLFTIRKEEQNKKLLAAGHALALLEAVRARTPVDRFASQARKEMVMQLESHVKGLKSNPDAYGPDTVQRLVDETIVMEKEALREQAKWRAKQNQAMTTVKALVCKAKMKLEVNSESVMKGIKKQEEFDPNYWTHGRYKELKDKIAKIEKAIASESIDMTGLDALIEEMKQLEKDLDCLREEAATLGLLSVSRILMTNDIANAMKKAGWKVVGGKENPEVGFMGGEKEADSREGTFAILQHPLLKEELSVIIFPESLQGNEVVNKIVFHRNTDRSESEGEFLLRLQQIKAEIEKFKKRKYTLGELSAPSRGGDGKIDTALSSTELKREGAVKKMEKLLQ